MRTSKKLLIALLAASSVATLASCTENERNTTTPMGNLDTTSVIASIEGSELTNGKYYTRLRATGYDTVHNQIKKAVFSSEYANVKGQINLTDTTVTDVEQDVFDAIATSLFGATDKETIEKLTEDEINTKIAKYIDSNNTKGITVTEDECKSYSFVDDEIKFSKLNDKLIENNLLTIAINEAAKAKLDTIVDNEEIEDKDGKLITNTFHISEKNIQNYYKTAFQNNGTYNAIIIQFNNLTEAKNAINAATATVGQITDANAAEFYAVLYNSYYNYRTQLDTTNPFASEETKYVVNDEEDELTKVSSSIKNFVTNTLEDGDYLDKPFNLSNKYIMVYRHSTTYDLNVEYNVADTHTAIEWADLKTTVGEENYNKIRAEVRSELIDNKISTYTSTIIKDRVSAAEIEIYDPFFENKFSTAYGDYEIINKNEFNNELIFKVVYNDTTTEYSVSDFYAEQSSSNGLTIVVDLLKLDYVYQYKDIFYTEDEIDDFKENIDKAVETFNKGENTTYAKELGLETYLLSTYGYTTVEDAKYATVAGNVLSKYLTHSVFDEWANEDHTINYENLNVLENMLNYGNKYYQDNNLFSINIDHLLIYIDDNSDGNPDDPEEFVSKLSDAEKTEFNNSLLALAQAVYEEANCKELTDSNELMEILNYIVKAYTRNETLYSNKDKTWADYKKYNFILKVESLSSSGDTTESNVNNYVKPFADYVKDLYKKAVADNLTVNDDEPIFYFATSGNTKPATMDDICATQFGYHMIIVNDYSEPEGTDIDGETEDKYNSLKNFDILLNEKDKDDEEDNIYVTVENVYNEKKNEATMNQFFTYYVEKRMGASSTLNTNFQSLFNSMFNDAISKYTSNAFQTFLLINDMNITINDQDLNARFVGYKKFLVNNSRSYETDTDFDSWYDGSLDWSRPYQK